MSKISTETILEQLNWRYAVKTFDASKKVSDADWNTLEQSLILAPTSYGLQPFKFVVVTGQEMKEKLRPAAYGQAQITDCSHLVVVTYKKTLSDADIEHYVDRLVEIRGTPREMLGDYVNMMKGSAKGATEGGYIETWNSRQAYLALGFLLETAALLEIDACPMEGFNPAQFNGYRDAEKDWLAALPKVRFPESELIIRK
jgi:nitroreductase